jgi:hypothetical protein
LTQHLPSSCFKLLYLMVSNNLSHFQSYFQAYSFIFGYGSILINTIFSGMNIHKSQLFWCELRGTRWDGDPQELSNLQFPEGQFRRADHGNHHSLGGWADFRVFGAQKQVIFLERRRSFLDLVFFCGRNHLGLVALYVFIVIRSTN